MLPQETLKGWIVLVVDDDPDSLNIVEALTTYYGANTHIAINGHQGLELARQLRPTIIITDLSMPVMDGWKMIEKLKNDRTTAEIPIIALTAHAMIGDRERAIAAGCHNYLSKPLMPDTFINDLLALLVEIPQLAGKLTWRSDN
jgi:CheY-like chemotaxis protein